jgi:hypothetical protein
LHKLIKVAVGFGLLGGTVAACGQSIATSTTYAPQAVPAATAKPVPVLPLTVSTAGCQIFGASSSIHLIAEEAERYSLRPS